MAEFQPPRPPSPAWRLLRGLLLAFYGMAVPLVLGPAVLLACIAETASGRAAGLVIIGLFALPPAAFYHRVSRARLRRRRAPLVMSAVLVLVSVAVLAFRAPAGSPPVGDGPRSVYLGTRDFRRFRVTNVVPEIDQIKLGCRLVPFLDPLIDRASARHLEEVTLRLYRELEAIPDYREMGSVLGSAYGEMSGDPPDFGHLYQYVPLHPPGERLPAIVFLHGSLGNFKAYLRAWQRFAERRRCIVVAPTFGFGNWDQPGGIEAVEQARAYCLRELAADPDRLYLAGLSNGGIGVCRAAAAAPAAWAGLILLTPVLRETPLSSAAFVKGWRDRPILVLSGARDNRIPLAHLEAGVARMTANGAQVTHRTYAEEDHFLFFSSLDRALGDIAEWMGLKPN